MAYMVFVVGNGDWGGDNSIRELDFHHMDDGKFFFELDDGSMRALEFADIQYMKWVAVGGAIIQDLIHGLIKTSDEHLIQVWMSMAAQREMMTYGVENPRLPSAQGMEIHGNFNDIVKAQGKAWKKELLNTLNSNL